MKDLIIKDMEMPINCVKCKIWSLCWNEDPYWFERREDCPLREITEDFDTISRGAAIEAVKEALNPSISHFVKAKMALEALSPSQLIQPPAQPDRQAIEGYLFNLYRDGLSLIDTESVLSRKHWIKQLYAEIFGEGERPVWMRKDE